MVDSQRSVSPSLDQNKTAMNRVAETSLKSLYKVWDEMGIDESQKKTRGNQAVEHVRKLMEAMVKEESNLRDKLADTVEHFTEKLNKLYDELSLPRDDKLTGLTLVHREKILRAKVETMTTEKNNRLEKYGDLHAKDQRLCASIEASPYYLPSGTVPSLEQLRELEKHVNSLQAEKEKRHAEFVIIKQKVVDLYNTIETDPDTSFSRDLVCEEDSAFVLSPSNMDSLKSLHTQLLQKEDQMKQETLDLWGHLKALWSRLETPDIDQEAFELNKEGHSNTVITALKEEIKACELLKFQNMQKFVIGIRNELSSWWDKCFFSQAQRHSFRRFKDDDFTEELLDAHEQELNKVQEYHKCHKQILEKIAQRDKLFKEMLVFEEKASDPNRFFNDRGGKLLLEEKARKKLMKELPKLEEEVTESVLKWEKENNAEFLVFGKRFPHYIVQQWGDFHLQKEDQKQSRIKAKAKQTQNEMLFGSVMSTPGKRKQQTSIITPHRTPLKAKKFNDITTKTPNTTSRVSNLTKVHHSTLVHSPYSSRQPLYTPKTTASKLKRRSIRLMKKAATDKKNTSRRKSRDTFSHTTVSSEDHGSSSLANTGSYHDFATGLSRPNCRSSVVPSAIMFPQNKR